MDDRTDVVDGGGGGACFRISLLSCLGANSRRMSTMYSTGASLIMI